MPLQTDQELANNYQKKTQLEHIKDAPDTYIGSVEKDTIENWILRDGKMEYSHFEWIPGLYKCFDEAIVNCRDHYIRLLQKKKKKEKNIIPVTSIDIDIDQETGIITLTNDGNGIDIAEHPEHKLWIPEMIFGHLMTSTNYKKSEKKIVGGKNGFGFKLVLIYSTWGKIETVDHIRKLKYTQVFKDNLSTIEPPRITKAKKCKPYTQVSFKLDFERFGIETITPDIFQLLKKRTYDIGAVTDRSVKVRFNKELVPHRTFEQYINLYIGQKSETKRIFCKKDARWEFAICLSPLEEFTHVSFVNGIYTPKGGKHVDYLLNQLLKKITAYILKKKKVKVKSSTIKEQLMLFVNCVIENPAFDSQTKETMNTPVSKFGSRCEIPDDFIDKVVKLGVMDAAISLTEIKDNKAAKKTDGKKTRSIRGIPKLLDANWAGGTRSSKCTLILCEGDSARAGIVSGLSKEDRNCYGVFPLKGKLMNVLDVAQARLNDNAEITSIKKIVGLETGYEYTSQEVKKRLRYGKILFMTDQDLDGAHIKGLCLNLFHSQWHDLVKIDSFLGFMNTPIIKATKGSVTKNFYYEKEYCDWKLQNGGGKGWRIKYYKGLGTSTAKEFKEYFKDKKEVVFKWTGMGCDNSMDLVFNKKRADDRKDWLGKYDKQAVLCPDTASISYTDFVDREMIHFSKYDCERNIPNLMDGLKISTRKILFAAFKRNLVKEIKVAQFAGYVSEHSCYHHGEKSLTEAIISQAQEFVGSNNISLLLPNGQFGTRLKGGEDHASERYIFTMLNTTITKDLFQDADKHILNYLDDDGTSIEPEYYAPIIPMVLVNGSKGIGTGFSTDLMCYNPLQIIQYIEKKLNNSMTFPTIEPYYEGFKGTIRKIASDKYLIKGRYKLIGTDKIEITELPIGMWTEKYKIFLESLIYDSSKPNKKKIIKSYTDMCTDVNIHFTIHLVSGTVNNLLPKSVDYGCNALEKAFRLYTTRKTSNMHLFDEKQQLKKYKTVESIIEKYYPVRLQLYKDRKEYLIQALKRIVKILSNKARFIKEQCDDNLDLRRKKKDVVVQLLKTMSFDILDKDETYKYLRTMSIDSVEEENFARLMKEKEDKLKELSALEAKSIETMWLEELNVLKIKYNKYKQERTNRHTGLTLKKTKLKRRKKKKN